MQKSYSLLSAIMLMCALLCADTSAASSAIFTKWIDGTLGFCSSSSTSILEGGALHFNDKLTLRYDGCEITAVEIINGIFENQAEAPFTIFFTKDLFSEPEKTIAAEMDVNAPKKFKTYTLDTPYKIQQGNSFYIGYRILVEPSNYSIGSSKTNSGVIFDGIGDLNNLAGFYAETNAKTDDGRILDWKNKGSYNGHLGIKLHIQGDALPEEIIEITSVKVPNYLAPEEMAYPAVSMQNVGTRFIDSLILETSIAGEEESTAIELTKLNLNPNDECCYEIPISINKTGAMLPLTFNITHINGQSVVYPDGKYTKTISIFPREEGFTKRVLLEEGTATGCGWCVRGIVGINRTLKAYPDGNFIPVAIFYPLFDIWFNKGYDNIWDEYLASYPSSLANRDINNYRVPDPNEFQLADIMRLEKDQRAIVDLSNIRFAPEGNRAYVSADIEFAFGFNDVDYRTMFILTEDKVGPYTQHNSYAGSSDMDGWENLPSSVDNTYYDHVARSISAFHGHRNSLPSTIDAHSIYTHSAQLDLSLVTNLNNCAIIAAVLDGKTGIVLNAFRCPITEAGVEAPVAEEKEYPIELFNLQGMPITTPQAGELYIERRGPVSRKMINKQL